MLPVKEIHLPAPLFWFRHLQRQLKSNTTVSKPHSALVVEVVIEFKDYPPEGTIRHPVLPANERRVAHHIETLQLHFEVSNTECSAEVIRSVSGQAVTVE
jgi:hypothetical protein